MKEMKIALMGYGRMGRAVEEQATERGHRIVVRTGPGGRPVEPGAVDPTAADDEGPDPESALRQADVAIDFSVGEAVPDNVARAARAGLDVVVGTTGWDDRVNEVRRSVEEADAGLLHAPNFSLGAHLFYRLAEAAASLVGPLGSYDVHVVESHHRHKRDHPSGTARRLADLLVRTLDAKDRWAEGPTGRADPETLEVTSVRVGEGTGLHLVGLDGPDDRIEIRHRARGRSGFARGAVEAAEWLVGRTGWFTLDDMLADRLEAGAAESTDTGAGSTEVER